MTYLPIKPIRLAGGLAILISSGIVAADDKVQFNIPAQSLSKSLLDYSEATGVKILFNENLARNIKNPELKGAYSTEDGLKKLLGESGLDYRFTSPKAVVVNQTKPESRGGASKEPGTTTLKAVTVTGQPGYADNDPYNTDYNRPNASTATKTDTPIMQTPFSVQVVSKQVMNDQQVTRLDKAVQNVSGVTQAPTGQGVTDSYQIRGFQNNITYRDGVLVPGVLGGSSSTRRDTANLERVEVLKGPGSILFGRADPGGIVNMVTKQPLTTPYYSLQQQFGSYDFYRTTADATAPITADKKLLYRLNLSYENAGSFRDFINNERVFVAPVVKWNISQKTQAALEFEYQRFNDKPDPGVAPIGNRPAPVPINRALLVPLNNQNAGDRMLGGFNWSHEFNDNWKLTHRFTSEFMDKDSKTTFFGPALANGTITPGYNNANVQSQRYFTTLNLIGNISTGVLNHKMLFGHDYFVIDDQLSNRFGGTAPAFNIFNPVYSATPPVLTKSPDTNFTQTWHGLYFQDQIELPYHLHALAGLRYDNAEGINNVLGRVSEAVDHISPRGGLLWQPAQWLSLYGSYTENFGGSNSLFNTDGSSLPPESAQQWETGFKTEFWDKRLRTTVSYFELTKQNLRTADPLIPNLNRAIGEAKSKGIEFDTTGELLPGWNIIAAYSYMPFAEITKDVVFGGGTGNQGNRLFLAPRNSGSLWSTYEFQKSALRGIKFGAGAVSVGQRQGNAANSYQLPGYVTANLMASYQIKVGATKVTTQLNVDNLLDKTYYAGTNSGSFITFGAPRTFMGSVRVEF
jgi:iron complex outermembrane recepter protein